MVNFVGAGCGAVDLITLRGKRLLEEADVIIYAGSLVNPQLLSFARKGAVIYDSSVMTLDEVLDVMYKAEDSGLMTVRLHTGDPSVYGAIREQMDALDEKGIEYVTTPGVSAAFAAAAALNLEFTLPNVSQSLIITRMEGKTAVRDKESIESFAGHGASMAVYLSAGMLEELSKRLIEGGYAPDTPAAICYRVGFCDEAIIVTTVENLADKAAGYGIKKTAVILVGEVIEPKGYDKSNLYDPSFSTEFRKAVKNE